MLYHRYVKPFGVHKHEEKVLHTISVETGVAVVGDGDWCGDPGITAGGMGLPSCHIHQKALSSLHSAFLFPSPLLHLADSFPAQQKKPPKSRERA